MQKDLVSIKDFNTKDIEKLFTLSLDLKKRRAKSEGENFCPLKGKTLAMLFQKSSTRTRVSFETGMFLLGGKALYLNTTDLQVGRGEPVKDTARVLSRYVDGILIRTFLQEEVEDFAEFASIPVINGLTDKLHPCQILSDMFTIQEKKGSLEDLKIAYIGDGNNIAHSWLYAAAEMGLHLWIACPEKYQPDKEIINEAMKAKKGKIVIVHDPKEAADQADILYTDVWASMGQEKEKENRIRDFSGFQLNDLLLQRAKKDVMVMHCLPAHREEEITDSVLEGRHSIIFDQAENRLYVQQAILIMLLGAEL